MSTSIKVKFRQSTVPEQKGSIYFQIIHDRVVRQLATAYKIYPSEWDDKHSTIIINANSTRKRLLQSIHSRIRLDMKRLTKICYRFDIDGIVFTANDIISEFIRYSNDYSLFNFMESIIVKLKRNGKTRTAEIYRATLNSFKNFRQNEDILIDCINADIMEEYEAWLRNRGLIPNSISFYTRVLRAVYNRAVERDIVENRKPFRHVYTGIDKTIKRALPLAVIKRIKALNLSSQPNLDYARDMFMMSFYLRGMSFIDMAFLKKSDLCNGYITYRRRKSGQLLTIEWTKEMQSIRDKYPDNESIYLLPIIKKTNINELSAYRNTCYAINKKLKIIAERVGVNIPLTLYVARHSWASAAKTKGIPLSIISEGMGHDSESTTQIYLASLDSSAIDKANALIIKSL